MYAYDLIKTAPTPFLVGDDGNVVVGCQSLAIAEGTFIQDRYRRTYSTFIDTPANVTQEFNIIPSKLDEAGKGGLNIHVSCFDVSQIYSDKPELYNTSQVFFSTHKDTGLTSWDAYVANLTNKVWTDEGVRVGDLINGFAGMGEDITVQWKEKNSSEIFNMTTKGNTGTDFVDAMKGLKPAGEIEKMAIIMRALEMSESGLVQSSSSSKSNAGTKSAILTCTGLMVWLSVMIVLMT